MSSVRIQLDNPQTVYTNLDFITGKVILSLRTNETISTITVKLEGESKSRLIGERPGYGVGLMREEKSIETEVHKVNEHQHIGDPLSSRQFRPSRQTDVAADFACLPGSGYHS
ncbi:MAG: hypothetical protein Q9179_006705, partial [Wetmoreana sp. 5 TL-2023]